MRTRLLSIVSVTLIALGFASAAMAQGTTARVDGHVVDASGNGVAGASVTVSSETTGLTRSVTTGTTGAFRMQLPPGEYKVTANASGFSSVEILSFRANLGTTSQLTIPMVDVEIEEIISYGTATELMPTATGETGLNISLEELAQLPVNRNIEAVALLAPGTVSGDVAFGDDKTLVSFGGASVAENVYYIDGLNVTNFRNGLGGASVPFEFYEQFQIKTGGYGAEFGRSTGGVLNALTKRGTNDWQFGAVANSNPTTWQGTSPNTILADGTMYDLNSENESSGWVVDLYASGPIIRDRLFFYVLYEPQETTADFNSTGGPQTWNEQKIDDSFWGGNLTWNITDNHSLSYTTFTDERTIVTNQFNYDVPNRQKGSEVGVARNFRGGENSIFRYDGSFGDNLVVSAMYGKNEYNLTDVSTTDLECPLIVDVSDSTTNFTPGCWITSTIGSGGDEREAYRFDVEYYLGDHTIRAGFDREDNFSIGATVYPGYNFTPDDVVGGIYYRYLTANVGQELSNGGIVPDVNGDGSRVDLVRTRYFENGGSFDTISEAWYIEDRWQINDQFVVSLGLRNEYFNNKNSIGQSFIEVDDQWAPRFAFEWSPGGTGEQRVVLNWGRYHLPIATNTNVRLAGAELDFQRFFVYDGMRDSVTFAPTSIGSDGQPTTQEIGTGFFASNGEIPNASSLVDQSLDPMFQDEWIVQYEREFGDNIVAGIRYIKRDLSSTIDDILVDQGLEALNWDGPIGSSQPCHYILTNPGTDVTSDCLTSAGTFERVTIPADLLGFPEAERTYEAVEVTFNGTFDRLSINGSYTWSENKGNTEGYVKSDIGQDDAGITQDFDIPQLMDGAYGFLPNDRTHKLKVWGAYDVTENLTVGANFLLQSGRPINAFGESHPDGTPSYGDTFYLRDGNGGFTFVPRGTAGRTPWINQLDLSAVYSFNLGDRADVELRADIFNVFNADNAREVYEFAEIRPDVWRYPTSYQRPRYMRVGASVRF